MAKKTETTAHGEFTRAYGSKNRIVTNHGVLLKASVLVMRVGAPSSPSPAQIGQVQSVSSDGAASVRWFDLERNAPNHADGTVIVESAMEKVPASELLAITPQRARLR